jgi:hypothetical protein
MKNSILPIIAFLAAISAFVLLPVSAVAATIAVSVTGILALLAGDYARSVEPVRAPAPVVPFDLSRLALTECRVAA